MALLSTQKTSYRQMMKATSIFGGVQVFNILISLLRSKVIAVLLGPAGLGLMGLFQTAISLVSAATNFGLATSAVREVSQANSTGDEEKISEQVSVVQKLVWMTGVLGMIVTIALSPFLSKLTFGHYQYTVAFIILAVTVLLGQLASGQTVVLQGLRKIKWLANASIYGSVAALLISIPLYYFFGIDGIVPALVLSSMTLLITQYWFSRKVGVPKVTMSLRAAFQQGKPMLKLGLMLSLSGLITVAASYVIRIYISNTGSVADVGLYNAGFAIIGTYVGLIFTAMGTDYYPRLAAVSHSNLESQMIINQQAEIALLILAPIILLFLVFINWLVILLYSAEFTGVNDMILYAALGMFFKAASWAVGYLFLAKGASSLFFWSELAANSYLLILNIIGYKYLGLTGLGLSFLISYILLLIQVLVISKVKYQFTFSRAFIVIFVVQIVAATACLVLVKMFPGVYSYTLGSIIIITSSLYSLKELDKRLDLKSLMSKVKNRHKYNE